MKEKREKRGGKVQTKKKRWLKFLCLFVLAIALAIPAAGAKDVFAATKSGSCGDSAKYKYNSSTKTLTISGSGTVEAPSYWDKISGSVKKLVVGDKITDIGTYTGWSALKTVSLGTKVKTINDYAFYGCTSLTTVDMGDSAVTKIGKMAFGQCGKLKAVTLSKKLTKISPYAFFNCSKLTSISLPSSLKTIGSYAFDSCGFTKVSIPKKVTSIGAGAFCSQSLTKIVVSSGNTKYSSKNGVLYNYKKTKLITYPAGKSSTSFTIPETVKTISAEAFATAYHLQKVNLNKVEKIGSKSFMGCSLQTITIPENVTSIDATAFNHCACLSEIEVSADNSKYSAEDGILYNKSKTKLITYPSAGSVTSSFTIPSTVKKIGDCAFYCCYSLSSVTIGSNVTEIGESAFAGSYIESITIGSNVTEIGYAAFEGCSYLTTVKFKGSAPSFGDEAKHYGGYAFAGVTAAIKYPSSEKGSWTKTMRSRLNAGAKAYGGKLTFKSY